MPIKDEIKAMIIKAGFDMKEVVDELQKRYGSKTSLSSLSTKLSNNSIRYQEVLQIAEICGYKIVWEKK